MFNFSSIYVIIDFRGVKFYVHVESILETKSIVLKTTSWSGSSHKL